MAKDARLYAKFCVDLYDHPKFVGLSDGAFRTWFEMVLWSRQHLTDGFIPAHVVVDEPNEPNANQLASTKPKQRGLWLLRFASELLHNDAQNPSLFACENGYMLHDFAQHQTTKSDIAAVREARIEAGRRGGIASGEARRKQTRSKRLKQTRSKTKPETETESTTTFTGGGGAYLTGDGDARRAENDARTPSQQAAGNGHDLRRHVTLEECQLCDDNGINHAGNQCKHAGSAQPWVMALPSYARPDPWDFTE